MSRVRSVFEAAEVQPNGRAAAARSNANGVVYPLFLLAVIVFIIIFPWHEVNQRLPIWDSADFVLTAQKIADRFSAGTLDGVRALYLERGWRPIIFPTIAAPFFVLTGGQILLSVGLVQLFSVLLMATYIFFFLRQEVGSARALVGTLLVVSTEWVVNFSNIFYSEIFWLAATAGAMFHLSAGLRGTSRLHFVAGGAWVGVMASARPVETVVIGAVPAALLLTYGWRSRTVTVRTMGLWLCQALPPVVATAILVTPDPNRYLALGLVLVSVAIAWRYRREFFSEAPLLGFLVAAELIAVGWHFPTMRTLYQWAHETSFGSLAQISDQRFSGLSPVAVFVELVQRYSPAVLTTLFVAAVAGAFALVRAGSRSAPRASAIAALFALSMIGPMLVLHALTGTSDMRRIMPGILVLYVGLTGIAVFPGGILPPVRLAVVFAMMAIQVTTAAANGLNIRVEALLAGQRLSGYLRQPSVEQDPNEPVLDGLLGLGIQAGNVSAYSYCYRDYDYCERTKFPPFEPVALATLARQRDIPINVHFIGDLDFTKPETLASQIQLRGFDYVLVDMFDSPASVNRADPYIIHTDHFISLAHGEQLPPGLVWLGCFTASNRPMCVIQAKR